MRDTTFKFEDFLKIIDNNTSSSIQARYGNKIFAGELIIITSSVPLSFWYRYLIYNNAESLKQLYRRISVYVEITKDEILLYNELDGFGKPTGFPAHFRNDIPTLKEQTEKKKTNFAEAFAKICEEIPIEEVLENYRSKKQ